MKVLNRMIPGFIRDLVSLLFPNLCCACNEALHYGEHFLCTKCLFNLPYTDHHLDKDNKTVKKFWGRLELKGAASLLHFRKNSRTQNIIYHLKYNGKHGLGNRLGELMAEQLQQTIFFTEVDLIIPVPLHKKKLRSRGYNQSEKIAEGLSSVSGIPVDFTTLTRQHHTESQTRKNRFQRFENMLSVFKVINESAVKGKNILLIDDVITTGATIEACAVELSKCGIKSLSIASAAFAD